MPNADFEDYFGPIQQLVALYGEVAHMLRPAKVIPWTGRLSFSEPVRESSNSIAERPLRDRESKFETQVTRNDREANLCEIPSIRQPLLLVGLPSHLLHHLTSFFTAISLASSYRICKALVYHPAHADLWKHLLLSDFGDNCPRCGCTAPFNGWRERVCFCDSCFEGCVNLRNYSSEEVVKDKFEGSWRSLSLPEHKLMDPSDLMCPVCYGTILDCHCHYTDLGRFGRGQARATPNFSVLYHELAEQRSSIRSPPKVTRSQKAARSPKETRSQKVTQW